MQYLYDDHWVLWYIKSNRYSIVDTKFKTSLDLYFQSENPQKFTSYLRTVYPNINGHEVCNQIFEYLKSSNEHVNDEIKSDLTKNDDLRIYKKCYQINEKSILLFSNSLALLNLIHPQLSSYEIAINLNSNVYFDILLIHDEIVLLKNNNCILKIPKHDIHILRGKIVMHIICEIHNHEEKDWLGTFHGTTISDGKSAILFVGQSGSGKTTISTILASCGFYMLADDVSPMLAKNSHIYFNPNGVSIKDTSSGLMKNFIKDYDKLPQVILNKSKGPVRYYKFNNPPVSHYPCKSIVLVNYKIGTSTQLEKVGVDVILEKLIPESWLSHNQNHAETFLKWLQTVNCYKLSYCDNDEMMKVVSKLFK